MDKHTLLIEDASELQYEIVEELNESTGKTEKNYYIKGIFSTPDTKNRNGRIYSRSLWENAIQKWHKRVQENPKFALGELEHPSRFEPDPMKAVMKIVELKLEDGYVKGKAKILNNNANPQIAQIKTLIDEGLKIGVSSRGSGRLKGSMVEEFELSCYDIVASPSDYNAMLSGIKESIEKPLIYESTRDTWVCDENGCKFISESTETSENEECDVAEKILESLQKVQETKKVYTEKELKAMLILGLIDESEYKKLKDQEKKDCDKKVLDALKNKEEVDSTKPVGGGEGGGEGGDEEPEDEEPQKDTEKDTEKNSKKDTENDDEKEDKEDKEDKSEKPEMFKKKDKK